MMTQPLVNISTSMLNETTILIGFIALALVIVGLLVAVVWLSRLYLKLNKNYITIESITQSNKNDIYGLCSAALSVNENTGTIYEKLHEV